MCCFVLLLAELLCHSFAVLCLAPPRYSVAPRCFALPLQITSQQISSSAHRCSSVAGLFVSLPSRVTSSPFPGRSPLDYAFPLQIKSRISNSLALLPIRCFPFRCFPLALLVDTLPWLLFPFPLQPSSQPLLCAALLSFASPSHSIPSLCKSFAIPFIVWLLFSFATPRPAVALALCSSRFRCPVLLLSAIPSPSLLSLSRSLLCGAFAALRLS